MTRPRPAAITLILALVVLGLPSYAAEPRTRIQRSEPAERAPEPRAKTRPSAPVEATEQTEAWLEAAVGRPNGLTSADAATRAVDSSITLQVRSEDVSAASAAVGQAVVAYLPRLSGLARYARQSYVEPQSLGTVVVAPNAPVGPLAPGQGLGNAQITIPSLENQTFIQATLVLPLSDYLLRISQTHLAASAARDAATLQLSAARLQTALDGRLTYYAWALAHLQTLVAEQALLNTRAHRGLVDRVFEAGGASKADVLRVDAQISGAELFTARVHRQEAVVTQQLRTLIHAPDEGPFEIGEALDTALPAAPVVDGAELFAKAKTQRLEVKALELLVLGFDRQARAARAGYFPRLDAFADAVFANPNPRYFPPQDAFHATWDVGVQLSYSPNEIAFASQVTDAVLARRRQAELQQSGFFDALRIEVIEAGEAVKEADLSVEATRHGLAAAEESYRVRKELFSNERSTSTELTDAETELTQARLNAVAARIDQRVARARLEHAIGDDVAGAAK